MRAERAAHHVMVRFLGKNIGVYYDIPLCVHCPLSKLLRVQQNKGGKAKWQDRTAAAEIGRL